MMKRFQKTLFGIFFAFIVSNNVWAFTPFQVEDIRLEGLQRISIGTVFNYLPLQVGEFMDEERSVDAIGALYDTGFFEDVILSHEDGLLIVHVVERPAIAEINISGNEDIDSEQLTEGLEEIGLAKGRTFNPSLLDKVEQELQRQYFSGGKYGVKIDSSVKTLPRNRVSIDIEVFEGEIAEIARISIIGNEAFSKETLLKQFQLETRTDFSFLGSNDQYSKQKLSGDLEALKSFYLDRGYVNFSVVSTQVSITPDKRSVYITVNIKEGEKYTIRDVKIAGDLAISKEELRSLISVQAGDVFSRRKITESSNRLSGRLGQDGYAFANINPVPDVDSKNQSVALTFFIDPGKRIYVRRINIVGNSRTKDVVLRREFRQMEGGWIGTDKINRTRERLQRLGFFEDVNVETPSVPGVEDQVDVNVSVRERSMGTVQAGMGYSESQGVLFTANITHQNFFGTGKRVSAEINTSQINTVYSFSYTNPYYTLDGVSRGFRGFYRKTDRGARNTASFNADTFGGGVDYGIPLGEFNRLTFGLSIENTKVNTTDRTPQSYLDFLEKNSNEFDVVRLEAGWSYDSRDRAIFPTKGMVYGISGEVAVPGSGLQYYKATVQARRYQPVWGPFTFLARGQIGWGGGYGETSGLPFFKSFFAGGVRSVRGFKANTLGPKDEEFNLSIGGALKGVVNLEMLFPMPFAESSDTVRMSLFIDSGNVYENEDDFNVSDFRASTGLSMSWLSPIGPMVFSLAKPIRKQGGDDTESFQFSLGASL
ncbi:Outer membrane protein assembly factor YaeT [hydrothermal vent metagenome]|uniref:Outer membrane protein assembly factor YaeT n=1 Tax=hydrothermal vent metagenome TaxID=652676 RepID=A0A3B0Z6X0_9ZZZZ